MCLACKRASDLSKLAHHHFTLKREDVITISECKVRQGRREDIPEILALVHEAKWYRTTDDVTFLFDNCPQGIFVAENSKGEVVCMYIQFFPTNKDHQL